MPAFFASSTIALSTSICDWGGAGSGINPTSLKRRPFMTENDAPDGTFTLDAAALDALAGGTLADGPHTLHLLAVDGQGNPSGIVDVSFVLDRQAPGLIVTAPLAESLIEPGAHVTGTVDDAQAVVAYGFDDLDAHSLVLGAGVAQLSGVVDTLLGSFTGEGGLASLGYAQLIQVLPISLFGVSVAAAQERLTAAIKANDVATVRALLSQRADVNAVLREADCRLLLDVNNLYVSAVNHRRDPWAWLDAFPLDLVQEIHLGGHATEDLPSGPLLIDDHGSRVSDGVWTLFADVVRRFGRRPTLIEWDTDLPPLAEQAVLRALAKENFDGNDELQQRYGSWAGMEKHLQLPDQLSCSIDQATGTGKSYVLYGLAAILLAEGVMDRVLVLCPSNTIEAGLLGKFRELAADANLRDALPADVKCVAPRVINASESIVDGSICVENYHAILENVKSSIRDSLKGKGARVAVLNDEADVGIMSYPPSERALSVIPLRSEPMAFVCYPGHRLARRRLVTPQNLATEPFVAFDRGLTIRKAIDRALRQHGVRPPIVMEFDNIETIKQAIMIQAGVSILPRHTVEKEAGIRTLAVVPFGIPDLVRPVGIIHRRQKRLTPIHRCQILGAGHILQRENV